MKYSASILLGILVYSAALEANAVIPFSGTPYGQNFDSLAATGTGNPWLNDSTILGWHLFRQPAPGTPITSYNAGTGSSNAGNFFSFSSANGDQALGGVASGGTYFGNPASSTVAGWVALALTNNTGSTINSFTLTYDGEQWRDGGVSAMQTPLAQTMSVEYGFGSTFETVATWNSAGTAFDFTSPKLSGTAGALDGNLAENRVAGLGGTIPTVTWNASDTLWVRWIEFNDIGSDHGLALDNVSFSTEGGGGGQDGDFDGDGDADGRDFLLWQRGGSPMPFSAADLAEWQTAYTGGPLSAFGAVPEPTSLAILALALVPLACGRKR